GCSAALAAVRENKSAEVIVTSKGSIKDSNTYWAQGGIAAVLDQVQDGTEQHLQDTVVAGAGLCDEAIVRKVVEEGPDRVRALIEAGLRVDREADGVIKLGKEGGHSQKRIIHTDGDATGKALATSLFGAVDEHKRVRLFEDCFVLDLITTGEKPGQGEVVGAITHHPKYGLQVIWARATILAAGGCGKVYRETTNPNSATGDGLAMAYRAGAVMQDMAFMQFHPTTLYIAGASRALITEAVRGEGAVLIDKSGHRFMPDYDERADLAPRDIVSRSILQQMVKTAHSHVYLDIRPIGLERFNERFPGIAKLLAQFDINPATTPIPVHPSAHYMVGGVAVDHETRSSMTGLYACGEASCSGLNGANRLASNSLLEGLVFGDVAGRVCLERLQGSVVDDANTQTARPYKIVSDIRPSDRSELDLADVRSSLRSVMWRHVGIEREGDHLKDVLDMFAFWGRYTLDKIFDDRLGWEVQNLLTIGMLVTRAAHWREESRGTQYRVDYPGPVDELRVHDQWRIGGEEPTRVPLGQAALAESARREEGLKSP
ncbi:MAG: L-aspartate oxidase, partial [Phycisphaeraceae bacterium]|nr:L-aspartate oxidase [Phycisphaeraceae bacterium]